MPNKKSPIHSYDKESFQKICKGKILAEIINEIYGRYNRKNSNTYYRQIKRKMLEYGMDYSSYKDDGTKQKLGLEKSRIQYPIEAYLKNGGKNIPSSRLRRRLIKEKLIKNICYECGSPPTHNNKTLTLQLDHIDGNSLNNELINLRLLCPNCHSQTKTFCKPKNSSLV